MPDHKELARDVEARETDLAALAAAGRRHAGEDGRSLPTGVDAAATAADDGHGRRRGTCRDGHGRRDEGRAGRGGRQRR